MRRMLRVIATGSLAWLSACQIVFSASGQPEACRHDGIELCLTFEDAIDGTTVDHGPRKLDALADGAQRTERVFRDTVEGAIDLTADSDVHLMNINAFDDLTAAMSFDAWARWGELDARAFVIDNSTQFTMSIRGRNDPFIDCALANSGNDPNNPNPQFPLALSNQPLDGEWHHIACVQDGRMLQIYVDGTPGVAVEAKAPNFVGGEFDLHLGRARDPNSPDFPAAFTGQIDNVRVWSRALLPEEIDRFRNGDESEP